MDQLKLVIRIENQEAVKVMAKHGVELIKPSENQIDEFKKVAQKAMQRQLGKSFSEKIKNEVSAYLEEYRKSKK